MPIVYKEVDFDVELDDFSDDDLIDELERRGYGADTVGETTSTELIKEIYAKRRLGKDFTAELDELIYNVVGKII